MVKINLVESVGYDESRLKTLKDALDLIEKIINSEEFKNKILSFKFYFRSGFFGYLKDTVYTNSEVYEMIMKATEAPGNIAEGSIDLYLHLIDGDNGSVIGYGNPTEKEIYTYKAMFDKMKTEALANHITHEWSHKLGFTHAHIETPLIGKRDKSVPYAIGNIVEELAINYL